MSDWHDEFRKPRDGVTIPTIWIAFAASLLLHIAVMWKWLPKIHLPSPEEDKIGEKRGSLVVQLAPPPRPPSAPSPSPSLNAQPAPPPRSRPPPPPPPKAPVIALKAPAAAAVPQPPAAPPVAAPAPPRPPAEGDLASYIEARRRARGDSPAAAAPPAPPSMATAPAPEDDKARANRIAAANLATQRQLTFGYDPSHGGGVFQIVRIGYMDAEFLFFGWNKDIKRNTKQLIEVQKGNNPDTRIAVVRKMISIIREYEQEDFLWESQRLQRSLTLSARARDNAGLEDFLMREFFSVDPRQQ